MQSRSFGRLWPVSTLTQVDQIDPGRNCRMHGGEAFVEGRLAPHHAETAAA